MVQAYRPLIFVLAAGSLLMSAAGVWAAIRLGRRLGAIDFPNERSSHSVPTPRMGGVAMVATATLSFACWVFLAADGPVWDSGVQYVFLFALGAALLGLWDDVSSLSPLFRFVVQACGAVLIAWATASGFSRAFPGTLVEWPALATVAQIFLGAFWAVWMLNLYNFMDGIDGLAGGEAAMASTFFFFVFAHYGEPAWAVSNLLIAAAAMGFLVHNWPPARVFMGDAGSAFLGAFYGMQSVVASLATPVPLPVLVLPFANFILDTTVTLLRRAWRGERWYAPHRSHYYQRLTALGMTHGAVTIRELFAVAASCAASGIYLVSGAAGRVVTVGAVVAGLVAAAVEVHRRQRRRQPEGR